MTNEWIKKKLKSINQIVKENPGDWSYNSKAVAVENLSWVDFRSKELIWHINDSMIRKFGDGEEYRFRDIEDTDADNAHYTHRGWDRYAYHESWFEDEMLDFQIEELFDI